MIALAMAVNPKLLIADEPTTALDVTTQAQILNLIKKIEKQYDTAIIMITHDSGVVSNIADKIAVMYAGKVVVVWGNAEAYFLNMRPIDIHGGLCSLFRRKISVIKNRSSRFLERHRIYCILRKDVRLRQDVRML